MEEAEKSNTGGEDRFGMVAGRLERELQCMHNIVTDNV